MFQCDISRRVCTSIQLLTLSLCLTLNDHHQIYPDAEVPAMQPAIKNLFQTCCKLALTLLEIMGHALKLKVSVHELK